MRVVGHWSVYTVCLLFFTFLTLPLSACIDSIRTKVTPVQCATFRNGAIEIDSVYGGARPYYFSLDSHIYSTNPVFDRLKGGYYTLFVRDASGCVVSKVVRVSEPEILRVSLLATDSNIVEGDVIQLRVGYAPETAKIARVEWRPPALFLRQDTLKQHVQVNQSTMFSVTVRDENECSASDQLYVEAEPTNLFFPNIIKHFSNQNAWFTVFAGEGVTRVASLQIYGRSGSLVFERQNFEPNNPLKGWNGRAQGAPVQPGVYAWTARIEFWDGKTRNYSGQLTVVN